MKWSDLPDGPSAEAQAYLADPANRQPEMLDLAGLPARRDEELTAAQMRAPALCAEHGVTMEWADVSGVNCLHVTPSEVKSDTVLIYLFGGGFIAGGPTEDLQIIAPIAAQTGMRVIAPNYRLGPEYPYPAALQDVQAVAQHIARSGPYQISGESAGGNLAASLTHWIMAEGLPYPSALGLMSPATDLTETYTGEVPDDPSLRPQAVIQISKTYAGDHLLSDPQVSPIFGPFGPDWPATLITTGTRDLFVDQCIRLHDTLQNAGATSYLRAWNGLWHVFEYYPEIPEAALSLTEIATFLKDQTRPDHA